jgi:hypothetical protein
MLRELVKDLPPDTPILQVPIGSNGDLVTAGFRTAPVKWHRLQEFYYEPDCDIEPHPSDPEVKALVMW